MFLTAMLGLEEMITFSEVAAVDIKACHVFRS